MAAVGKHLVERLHVLLQVESSKTRQPPTPTAEEQAMKDLGDGWGEYRSRDKRSYYYNKNTGEKNWKPPRKKLIGQVSTRTNQHSPSSYPLRNYSHMWLEYFTVMLPFHPKSNALRP